MEIGRVSVTAVTAPSGASGDYPVVVCAAKEKDDAHPIW
jgi:hypothetical protein